MNYYILQQAAEKRRSIYTLDKNLPLSAPQVSDIIRHAVTHTPSSFNSQSTRVAVLFNAEHEKLWQLTEDILRDIMPSEKFASTKSRLDMLKAAAGSVLFFEEQTVISNLQLRFPIYADNFPVWADHANAMHQYAIWITLAAAGIGANLQHYNPLIDRAVKREWDIPSSWTLRAQMVFGGITAPAAEKPLAPAEERMKIFGL